MHAAAAAIRLQSGAAWPREGTRSSLDGSQFRLSHFAGHTYCPELRLRLVILRNYKRVSRWAAHYVAWRVRQFRPTADRPFVLGLPTGSSPLGMYERLLKLCQQGKLSFRHVVTFNMDEYVGLPADHPQSYRAFMW